MTLHPGKLAVIGILLVAVGLAGFAWWWNWQRTQRCREFYGGEGAHLIRTATQVEGLTLSRDLSGTQPSEELQVGPDLLRVASSKELGNASGFIHARTALLDDNSYQWDNRTTGDSPPLIPYAVRFRDGKRRLTLAFDFGSRSVHVVETHHEAVLAPKIAAGWESFLKRQLAAPAAAAP
jgi:hypothetical protein